MKKFEYLDHTADIGIRVFAKTHTALFAHAAEGLYALIFTRIPAGKRRKRIVTLNAPSMEDLIGFWLNELISLFYTYSFIATSFTLTITGNKESCSLKADLEGIIASTEALYMKEEIKAASYHNIKISENKRGYEVDIIFDV